MNQTPDAPHEHHFGFSTEQVHAGYLGEAGHGARITPIYLSAGFVFDDFEQARARFAGTDLGYVYSRINNPSNAAVEKALAELEHGVGATLTGSGQAAATVALLSVLKAGDHMLSAPSIYEGTRALFRGNFARFGIEVEFVEHPNDPDDWHRRVRENTRLFFGEAIPNPKNDLIDVEAIATAAHEHGLPFAIDATVATPYLLRPIDYGADIVFHSTSKFLAGHGSSIGGVVIDAGRFDWAAHPDKFPHLHQPIVDDADGDGATWIDKFGAKANFAFARAAIAGRFGTSLSPFNAFLLQQGIETLSLRLDRHTRNALAVASWLEQQPEVSNVDYAGLPSNPYHALAQKYYPTGAGSVFAFTLSGGQDAARVFYDSVEVFTRMTHIGDVRSLILHPPTTTHSKLSAAERDRAGIHPGLLRLSVGIEDVDDLIADLDRAFRVLRGENPPPLRSTGPGGGFTPAEGL
ncbi:O-acetylhomoserine aminocarboxypropyltransferase/cysteine synthase family protein [Mycetocola reblochoni]|uniref:homocysteine desulfhydrase n=2 Tax=Mycetocola reblochoni TaxID=331618 RepID=A0A1R4IGA3_9MICO|nr:O-acetylhomoserine aminocarboxypropyltransferase/cysteine synthase family protein [Mycetocola reblochoni]RLP68980.1 O-acetylhomoserine aminocarboxypropyltransferase/cysteine synthase [Mycetocola reblochoni]SJN18634.1 O-acetylhomoserine sulfhydrylase / O-succinylhomoserine sulfhydrylase [Mycetocola reblochoni REB411]